MKQTPVVNNLLNSAELSLQAVLDRERKLRKEERAGRTRAEVRSYSCRLQASGSGSLSVTMSTASNRCITFLEYGQCCLPLCRSALGKQLLQPPQAEKFKLQMCLQTLQFHSPSNPLATWNHASGSAMAHHVNLCWCLRQSPD